MKERLQFHLPRLDTNGSTSSLLLLNHGIADRKAMPRTIFKERRSTAMTKLPVLALLLASHFAVAASYHFAAN